MKTTLLLWSVARNFIDCEYLKVITDPYSSSYPSEVFDPKNIKAHNAGNSVANAGALLVTNEMAAQAMNVKSRALPDAPSGYAPVHVTCPSIRPVLRAASNLSPEETAWINIRREKTKSAMKDFFGHVHIGDFDAVSYLENHSGDELPSIAIGISGGGLVAALNGGGAIKAFDERTEGATAEGQLGGLLQASTYLSALSGGSWALGSMYINNFTTVSDLQDNLWDFTSGLEFGPGTISPLDMWGNMTAEVKEKREAGFSTGDADFW